LLGHNKVKMSCNYRLSKLLYEVSSSVYMSMTHLVHLIIKQTGSSFLHKYSSLLVFTFTNDFCPCNRRLPCRTAFSPWIVDETARPPVSLSLCQLCTTSLFLRCRSRYRDQGRSSNRVQQGHRKPGTSRRKKTLTFFCE
jgi:hypothetical protein